MVLFVSVIVPLEVEIPPPRELAELPLRVVVVRDIGPDRVNIPPPEALLFVLLSLTLVFSLSVLLIALTNPEFAKIPPPRENEPLAMFSLTALSINATVQKKKKIPPPYTYVAKALFL